MVSAAITIPFGWLSRCSQCWWVTRGGTCYIMSPIMDRTRRQNGTKRGTEMDDIIIKMLRYASQECPFIFSESWVVCGVCIVWFGFALLVLISCSMHLSMPNQNICAGVNSVKFSSLVLPDWSDLLSLRPWCSVVVLPGSYPDYCSW